MHKASDKTMTNEEDERKQRKKKKNAHEKIHENEWEMRCIN